MLKFDRDILEELEPVGRRAKVMLFGSVARDDYGLDSGIGLAIVTNEEDLKKTSSPIADEILEIWKSRLS